MTYPHIDFVFTGPLLITTSISNTKREMKVYTYFKKYYFPFHFLGLNKKRYWFIFVLIFYFTLSFTSGDESNTVSHYGTEALHSPFDKCRGRDIC